MKNVNKQLLDAEKKVLEKLEGKSFVGNDLRDDLRVAIAAAEQAQQAEQNQARIKLMEHRKVPTPCPPAQPADVGVTAFCSSSHCVESSAQQQADLVTRDVLTAALNEMRDACSFAVSGDIGVKSADKVMAGVDIAAIVDRHAAQPPAVAEAVQDVIEQIAQQWDECMYDSADCCHIDIGQAIRQAGQQLAAAQKGNQ